MSTARLNIILIRINLFAVTVNYITAVNNTIRGSSARASFGVVCLFCHLHSDCGIHSGERK